MKKQMTLAYALQWKKTVAAQLVALWHDLFTANSVEKPMAREVDVKAAYELAMKVSDYLIELQQVLDTASAPSRKLVLEKKELIDRMSNVQRIPTRHGPLRERGWDPEKATFVEYDAIYRKADLDLVIKDLQRRINRLQMEIDARNASITIEFDIPEYVEQPVV